MSGVEGEYSYSLHLPSTGPATGLVKESLTLGDRVLFCQASDQPTKARGNSVQHIAPTVWTEEPALVEVPAAGKIALGRIPSLAEVVIAYTVLTDGIGCYTFHNDVMKRQGGNQKDIQSGLNDIAGNYLSTMKEIVSNLQDLSIRRNIAAALRRVNADVTSVELNDLKNPTHAVVGHQFGGRTLGLNLAQESEGFRRFFAHLLALYQRPPKQLLMFEHPEDGIHPGALALLAEEFLSTPGDDRGQIILTSHSPGLLDQFSEDQIRVVEREEFQTRIGSISREQKAALHEQLMDPGELLTVDPARLDTVQAATE
ncbi:MAG: ATP-binding protein [Planctomycetaceae bacterium]